jgi:hypothetical protein
MQPTPSSSGSGKLCADCLEDNSNVGVTGIAIEVSPNASPHTRNAAHALYKALKAEYLTAGEMPSSSSGSLAQFGQDPKLIVVTMGLRL